jgi:hypothetical protein
VLYLFIINTCKDRKLSCVMTQQIFARIRGLITATAHKTGRNPKIESRSDLLFIEIVTESKTCHIYKAVLLTIKVAARNASGASNS